MNEIIGQFIKITIPGLRCSYCRYEWPLRKPIKNHIAKIVCPKCHRSPLRLRTEAVCAYCGHTTFFQNIPKRPQCGICRKLINLEKQ